MHHIGRIRHHTNHIHGIIVITETGLAGTGFTPAQNNIIGDIVGAYKSLVANKCLKLFKAKNELMGKLWQSNYWEHIIRDNIAYQNIILFIKTIPLNGKTTNPIWNNILRL